MSFLCTACGEIYSTNPENLLQLETPDEIQKDMGTENKIDDSTDYSFYLKKIWLVDGWKEYERDYPISLVFTKIEKEAVEGYIETDGMIASEYFWFLNNASNMEPTQFHGMFYEGTAKCEYAQSNGNAEMFYITFGENDRIEAKLEKDQEQSFLLRPYNLSDEEFKEPQISYEIELDSWGFVKLFYANTTYNHSIPEVLLINDHGDILYSFAAGYQSDSEVLDIIIEDMDGNGLKDVEVITYFSDVPDAYRFEWYFYQNDNGLFYQGLTNMFGDDL